ncbi:hypothetical protein [Pseudonocardia sp.]|uniref:hypothetical protein n=1 Tax=Pseudonocardia sp. TaxID=60912 RepID=UPI0026356E4C|nr:hypothetical protein [Pseudonocardia sp.]
MASGYLEVQLDWVAADQGRVAALAALLLTVPLQVLASVFGFLARDPVAETGMGLLAGAWAVAGMVTLTSAPGTTSRALGVVLLAVAAALLVPCAAATGKILTAAVMAMSALRFAATGVYELTASGTWATVAGWIGVLLALLAL